MSLNSVPSGERIQIGFFGRRNAGKSSLVNAVTGQEMAVVDATLGTTTDPVIKAMEILPLGPVVIIDTPGFDDEGRLGSLRVKKTKQILTRVDVAILVVDVTIGISECDKELIDIFNERKIPYIIAWNKTDILESIYLNNQNKKPENDGMYSEIGKEDGHKEIRLSSVTHQGIDELKELIGTLFKFKEDTPLLSDLIEEGDVIILVIPIDASAPKGRVILPQQQVLREILDCNAMAFCVQPKELPDALLKMNNKVKMVITDSQAFVTVKDMVPENIYLTSFSILMARHKGILKGAYRAVKAIDNLKDGDRVLISEGCTHHRQCEDIGTVKLPKLLRSYTGKKLVFEYTSGNTFADDIEGYDLVIHCGGCMLGDTEVRSRLHISEGAGIPMTNYGLAISYMRGILERSISVIPEDEL